MFINDIKNIFDIPWNEQLTYGEVRRVDEVEQSTYAFEEADIAQLQGQFEQWENEAGRLLERGGLVDGEPRALPLAIPAYEATLRCSHLFNVLDARGAFSVTERAAYIQRIRSLSCRCARAWVEGRTAAGFPLLSAAASGGASS
jgi:glycyl-tRNA synthetase alpha chain